LPSITLSLYRAQAQPDPVAAALADIVRQCVRDSSAAWATPSALSTTLPATVPA